MTFFRIRNFGFGLMLATALSLLGLIVYGVGTIQDFALGMLVGIISGTYSTWYIASPMTIWLDELQSQRKAIEEMRRIDKQGEADRRRAAEIEHRDGARWRVRHRPCHAVLLH